MGNFSQLALAVALVLLTAPFSASAGEDIRGSLHLIYPGDVTLYGYAWDLQNPANTTFRVQVCWDSPSMTSNCDVPVTANGTTYPFLSCAGSRCDGFHYTIPTGKIGAVTPRDGNPHFLYAKIISQADPGPGDKIVDGSPWPFTFRNGTVAPSWAPNLEAAPSRLTAAHLAVIANSQDPYSVGSRGNMVCVVNGTTLRDDGIAGYYVSKHRVPCSNVFVVSMTVSQVISQSTFTAEVLPVIRSIPASLQAAALGWVEPSIVGYTQAGFAPQSISAAIANGGLLQGSKCANGTAFLGYGPLNPFFNSKSGTPFTDYGLRPVMMLAGEICPSCTTADNYSYPWLADFATGKAVIDAAIAATDTDPSGGNVFYSRTGDIVRSETAIAASPLVLGNTLSPYVDTQILGSLSSPNSSVINSQQILLYDQGLPHWTYAHPTFLPGAGIGFSVTSTSGALPFDGNQTSAASWLEQGAVAAFGNAVEPCELLTYKSPDPALLIPFYTQGQTAIEALWKSVRLPWGANFVGDPLAAPFRLGQGTSAPTLSSISAASGTAGASVTETLSGSNFSAGSVIHISGSGVTASNVNVLSSTQISASFSIAVSAPAGPVSVTVTTASATTSAVPFTVTAGKAAPTLTLVSPNSIHPGTAVSVTLTGTNFTTGSVVAVSGVPSSVSAVKVISTTQITAALDVPSTVAPGTSNITVMSGGVLTNALPLTIAPAAAPALTSLTPAAGARGTTVRVTLVGTNFTPQSQIRQSGIGFRNLVVVSSTQIDADFFLPATAAGVHTVYVINGANSSNTLPFTVY